MEYRSVELVVKIFNCIQQKNSSIISQYLSGMRQSLWLYAFCQLFNIIILSKKIKKFSIRIEVFFNDSVVIPVRSLGEFADGMLVFGGVKGE